jgi:hypothetical protein
VLIYFGALYALKLKYNKVKSEVASLNGYYTNAVKDRDELQILEDRQALKFAALDCYKTVAVNLPETVSVDTMYFDRQKFELMGTASADDQDAVRTFNDALRHAQNPNKPEQPMFAEVAPPKMNINGDRVKWSFDCDIKDASP